MIIYECDWCGGSMDIEPTGKILDQLCEAGWTTVCHDGEYKHLCTGLCLERFLRAANYQPQEATA